MTPEQQSRLEKIRALLAKAESTPHPEEAKIFSAKAQELMSKWAIDEAMLNSHRQHETYSDIHNDHIWLEANEYRAPKVQVLNSVALANDCKLLLFTQQYIQLPGDDKPKRRFKVAIIGYPSDTEFVKTLYTSLLLQLSHELLTPAVLAQKQLECDHPAHSIKWRNSFTFAYASAVYQRLMESKRHAESQARTQYGNGLAMVLVGKASLVQRKLEELYPNCTKSKKSSATNDYGSSSRLGHQAGNRADLGSPKVGGSNRKQIN